MENSFKSSQCRVTKDTALTYNGMSLKRQTSSKGDISICPEDPFQSEGDRQDVEA